MPRVGDYRKRPPYDDEAFRSFMGRVKLRCFQLGWNMSDLARACDINHATVSGWFALKYMPQFPVVMRMPDALQCSADWLLTGKGSPDKKPLTEVEGQVQGASLALQDVQVYLDNLKDQWAARARKKGRSRRSQGEDRSL